MTVKAKTEYTKESLLKLAKFNSYKKPSQKKSSQTAAFIVLQIVMLGLVAFSIYGARMEGSTEDIIIAAIFTVGCSLFIPLVILITPIFAMKISSYSIGTINTYVFSDNGILKQSTLTETEETNMNYNRFEMVCETDTCFYFYISKDNAYIMNKSDITEGSVSELQELLKKNMPSKKYIVKPSYLKLVPILFMAVIALTCGIVMLGSVSIVNLSIGLLIGAVGLAVIFGGAALSGLKQPKVDNRPQAEKLYDNYASLVDKAEAKPTAFERKLKRLCYLGKAYIFLLFISIALLITGFLALCIYTGIEDIGGFIFGIFGLLFMAYVSITVLRVTVYSVMKSFSEKNAFPDMPKVSRNECPLLFEMIDEASAGISSAKMDEIYLSPDATCAVIRIPIGFKNHDLLCVGLYLLEIFNREELKSVFFHEFAHISNKDTKTGQRVAKILTRWQNIVTVIERKRRAFPQILFGIFSKYYITKLEMHLAAIAKQREYLADKIAVENTSPEVFAASQAKTGIMHLFLSEPNESDGLELRKNEKPPEDYFNQLFSAFYKQYDNKKTNWISQIKKPMSSIYDSHPTFVDRIKAVGIDGFSDELSFEKDNNDYQNEINRIINKMNGIWVEDMEKEWGNVREEYVKSCNVIDEFTETDDETKLLEYGMALESISENDKALIVYDKMLDNNSDNAAALFRKGQILLNRMDERGLLLIKRTVNLDSDYIENGLTLMRNYLFANGMEEKLDELQEWANEKIEIYTKKQDEIDNLYSTDRFLPYDLSDETIEKVKEILRGIKGVTAAYLVKKELKNTDGDYYVLAIMQKKMSFKKRQANLALIVEKVNELGFAYFLLDMNANISFSKTISLVKKSEIFRGRAHGNK